MDCMCCCDCGKGTGGAGPASETEFLGTICRLYKKRKSDNDKDDDDDDIDETDKSAFVKFPAEAGRYTLYVIAGCPFAARPWSVMGFYGLATPEAIRVVKLFPASEDQGWFFTPTSAGEQALCKSFPDAQVDADPHHEDVHHLSQLYYMVNPDFKGAISVPLLWDSKENTAVSNSSMGLAEMLATQMRGLATQNQDILLFPCCNGEPELYQKHAALCQDLHSRITLAVYTINATADGVEREKLVNTYYAALDEYEELLSKQPCLMGEHIRFADFILFISMVRLDLAYQWRFGLGRKNIRENYPNLTSYQKRILALPGIAETVLPRDLMALYFMTQKWTANGAGRTLPQVPEAWERTFCPPPPSK